MNDWKKITNISVFKEIIINLFPGFFVSALIAIAAQFISDHYSAPAMLMALLFGIALNFLSKETYCNSGISFSATVVLRFVIAFVVMVFINSLDIVPSFIQTLSEKVSRWFLLIAIGAVGLKTSLKDVLNVGGSAVILLFFQTIFIGVLTLVILIYFPIFD